MSSSVTPDTSLPQRSELVSVVAWIFIVLAGFTSFVGLVQNIMIHSVMRGSIDHAMRDTTFAKMISPPQRFMMAHMSQFIALTFVASTCTFVAAIGLLRRKNWARLVFMALLGLGIAWFVVGLIIMLTEPSPLGSSPLADSLMRHQPRGLANAERAIEVFTIVLCLACIAAFGWIIKRLSSPAIAAEFNAPRRRV